MIAVPNVKIARPLNSPRSVRKTPRLKGRIQSSRSEYEDQETLAQQKNDIIKEILALRKECDTLQAQVYDKETDFDEQQSLEIEYLNIVEDKKGSEYKSRVLIYTKQVAQLENEIKELSEKHTFLSTYFSEDSIFRLKNEIVYEKNSIGHQIDDLKAVMDVRNKALKELQSEDLAKGIRMCKNQRAHLTELKKQLKEIQEKENELNSEYQDTLVLPKKIEDQEKEIVELQKRLQNCQHTKSSKQRDINKKKEEVETEKSVMNNVTQMSNAQKTRSRERENFSNSMTRSTRIFGRNGRIIDVPAFKKTQRQMSKSDESDEYNKTATMGEDDFEKTGGNDDSDLNATGKSNTSTRSGESEKKSDSENSEKKSDDEDSEKKSDDEDSEKKSDSENSEKKSDDEDSENSEKKSDDEDSEKKSDDEDSEKKSDDDDDSEKKSDDDDTEKDDDDNDDKDSEKKSDDEENDTEKDDDDTSDTDEME